MQIVKPDQRQKRAEQSGSAITPQIYPICLRRLWYNAVDRLTFYVYYKLDWIGSIEFVNKIKLWFAFATRS